MNKVICNLCGTSYPENATQCPICGYVRSADAATEDSGTGTYTYVKGGRFSKANVKKRNKASGIADDPIIAEIENEPEPKKKSKGLLVVMIVLLVAIVLVLGYIAVQFLIPGDLFKNTSKDIQETLPAQTIPATTPATTETTENVRDLTCKAITLSTAQIQFDSIGATMKLTVQLEPADTTDSVQFTSSDETVATVSEDGTVSAVGEGSATITASCGSVKAECSVTCTIPTETSEPETESSSFVLNRKEITFNQEGQTWLIYDGDILLEDIVWSSDDNDVATITNGRVSAVGNGDTTVYGIYDGETVSCLIHCDFSATGESGGISEAGGASGQTYKLHNPVGYADDVTIYVGEQFPLLLVDENENEVTGAKWEIVDESICTYADGLVEATGVGTTEVTATYNGVTYICTVRVVEE